MVGRYIFSVFSCVLDDLYKREIEYATLSSSVIIDNYSDLGKTDFYCSGLHHGYAGYYCKEHKEQLLKCILYEVCKSAIERCSCSGNESCIVACNDCFEFYINCFST